jgi:hypothetical protein
MFQKLFLTDPSIDNLNVRYELSERRDRGKVRRAGHDETPVVKTSYSSMTSG